MISRMSELQNRQAKRLVGTLIPFILMLIVKRLTLLIISFISPGAGASVSEIISFILSCIAAVAGGYFASKRFFADDGDDENVPELNSCVVTTALLYVLFGVGLLIACRYAMTIVFETDFSKPLADEKDLAGIISAVCLHPLLDEYIFRKKFYGSLRKMNQIFGGLAQALMFAICQSTVTSMVFAVPEGIIFALLTEKTGSVKPAIVVHMIFSLRDVFASYVTSGTLDQIKKCDILMMILGFAAFVVLIILRASESSKENVNTETSDGQ